jgi:DMSO/TMAO reductase YedYZ heme-binding membrane subunit
MGPWLEIKNLVLFYILHMYHILFDSPEQMILHIEVLLILFIFNCLQIKCTLHQSEFQYNLKEPVNL